LLPGRVTPAAETARVLGVCESYLSQLVRAGMPVNRVGGQPGRARNRFDVYEARLWLESYRAAYPSRIRAAWEHNIAKRDKSSDWLNPRQAANLVGCGRSAVRRWCDAGLIPCERTASGAPRVHRIVVRGWYKATYGNKTKRVIHQPHPSGDLRGGVVYAFTDPRPERLGQIRYIGKSENLSHRMRDYRREAKGKGGDRPVARWLRKLTRLGLKPGLKILGECLFGLLGLEREWIAKGRAKGWPLLNVCDGGEGGVWSDEGKRQQSERTKRLYADPEYVRKFREGQLRRWGYASPAEWEAVKAQRERDRQQNRQRHQEQIKAAEERRAREKQLTTPVPLTHKGTAFLPLTRGAWAMIDLSDWERVQGRGWYVKENHGRMVPITKKGGGITYLKHFIFGQPWSKCRNGNELDCRRANLVELPVGRRFKVERADVTPLAKSA
jgi:hypothetical protein